MKDERISSLLDSNNELSLELTQKIETIQSLENEIKCLKEVLPSAAGDSIAESETVETTATYESFDDEPLSQCNDLTTQTDAEIKAEELISEMTGKRLQIKQHINVFKEKYQSMIDRFEEDIDYVESSDISVSSESPDVEAYEQMLIKLNLIEQKFNNLIKSYAHRKITMSQLEKIISKIPNQKAVILNSKRKNELLRADVDYAESIEVPKITGAILPEDIDRLYENAKLISTRLKTILSKLNSRTKSDSSSKVTGSRPGLHSERPSPLKDQPIPMKSSELKTYKDLSAQTDFNPRITIGTFRKYDFVRRNCNDPKSHLSELEELFETTKRNNEIAFNVTQKNTDRLFKDFKMKALKQKDKIKFEMDEFSNFFWVIKSYRESGFFPNRAEIMAAVKNQFSGSSVGLLSVILNCCQQRQNDINSHCIAINNPFEVLIILNHRLKLTYRVCEVVHLKPK